jgi:hypothetical protein
MKAAGGRSARQSDRSPSSRNATEAARARSHANSHGRDRLDYFLQHGIRIEGGSTTKEGKWTAASSLQASASTVELETLALDENR